ncbi:MULTISPECIES: MFS transporter [unclassified Gordonia (in: high G+C Gram-positive bacteria)]|uniref:MFS transporter n=1 Tax=unclassified Gordonia (in: high G+C Gram-positive bacteria) TaxID=2657482 RepID=UPI001966AE05|nr:MULTISPECIES: MFS transporter [unclassified Gordonia (in: high G+C Gram-positive bacteria)]MBN0972296.1 MFS transporter [Gordonia sp. BP-119]MBN0983442.1 MFS transporter [Gordonia sp. BP-94]
MTSAADSRLPRALLPFARRQYRLLASGLILAMFADGVWTIAVIWQIIALGGGPGQVSLATGVAAVGMLVSTLAGGVLADRISQRHIMIGLEVAKMIAFGAIGLASIAGVLQLWHVVVASLLGGITTGMYYPAYSALLPGVVAPSELQAANGIEGFFRPVVFQAVGPMVAGAVIGAWAPGSAVLMAAVAAILSSVCYLGMAPVTARRFGETGEDAPEVVEGAGARRIVGDLAEGFAYMARTPWLWGTLLFACVLVLATLGPIEVLVPFALRERVDGGATQHAWVLAGFGLGAAAASLVFASIPMPRRYLTVMFSLWAFSSLPLVLMGLADSTWMFVAAGVTMGILFDGPMVLWGTLLQRRVPPALLGRIASLDFFVSVALMPVSMAIAAPVSSAIGLTATFVLAGLLPVPIAWAFYFAAGMWRDEIENPLVDESNPKLVDSAAVR